MSRKIFEIKPVGQQTDARMGKERAEMAQQLAEKQQALLALADATPMARVQPQLDVAELLIALNRKAEAWKLARVAFAVALAHDAWKDAVEACDVLYQCEQEESIAALGMGVWLSVSFPVDPELTLTMLMHIVEETPDHSDHAALAAITARYVIDLRTDDERHASLTFLADSQLAKVAERQGNVRDQAALNAWMDRLELRDPQIFLPRLAQVINIIVGDQWWFDRDELRSKFD